MGTSHPLPLRKQQNMFCQWQGGVGWSLWLQARTYPPSGSTSGAGSLLLLEGRAGSLVACFLQLSKQGELGRKPSVLFRGLRQTLCHNKGTMTWMDRWVDGRLAPSALFPHLETGCRGESWDRSPLASPVPCLVFYRVGHTVSHLRGQGK